MKKLITITILFIAISALVTPVYADYCDDIAQSYQPLIDRVTLTTVQELGRRGISPEGGLFQKTIDEALQPIISEMNYKIADCKYQQALKAIPVNNPTNIPTPTPIPQVFYTIPTATPQPTPTPQVIQIIVVATPTPTPLDNEYPTLTPSRVIYNKPTPEISHTATPSSIPTPTPTKKPMQQKRNIFQNITRFFQNIYRLFIH